MAVKVPIAPKLEPEIELSPPEFENFEEPPEGFEILDTRTLPPFPAKNIEANRDHLFWEWQEKLIDPDWNHLVMYLFREFPFIDRTRINPKANINIEVIGSKFSKNSKKFLEEHGSGKYKLLVNDSNKAVRGKGGTLGTVRFEVNDPEHPPIFVLEELVPEHPSNKSITSKLVAEGKLTLDGRIMQNTQGGTGDNAALIGLLTQLINKQSQTPVTSKDATAESMASMFSKTHETAMAMLKDQVKSDDPEKLVKMLAALKEMMPQPSSGNDSLALIVKMQSDMAKVQADAQASRETMMLKMMEMMNAKPSGEDQEDKILARIATYKELFGGGEAGGSRKKDIWETAIEYGAPVLGKVLDTIQGFVNIKNFEKGMKQQATQPQQQQTTVELPAAIEPQTEGESMPTTNPDVATKLTVLIKGPAGAMIIGAMQRNESGDAFADGIKINFGRMTYDEIASVGKDQLIAVMKTVPEFWNQVVPSSVEKFIDEFMAYGQDESEEEGEQE